jgi:hypothetical protein
LTLLAAGCGKAPPAANPEFSDAAVYVFRAFDDNPEEVAYGIRALEEQIYLGMDVEARQARDRALTPEHLTEEDIAHLEHTGASLADALPVAVAGVSAYEIPAHALIPLLVDQRPVEPYSPTYFEREFLEETEECWYELGCDVLLTWNDLIKENLLMTVPYHFYKDFRWVDLNLPDPADVPPGEEAVNEGESRWSFVARSWMTEPGEGENGNTHILQAYTIEVWVPRDGQGFVRDGTEENLDDGEWTADSTGGGALRLLSLWSQTVFDGLNVSDDVVAAQTRTGIDNNFEAQEDWLDEHF